jgi:hypothetical protein
LISERTESSGAPLHHYVEMLHEKRSKYRWRYAQHWLPHDVKQRELNTAMSRVETLRSLGVEPDIVPAHHRLDSVNATRRMLDRTWIDPVRCERGLDCLKNYRYEWKDKQRIWTAYPLHDWASHGADALATFAGLELMSFAMRWWTRSASIRRAVVACSVALNRQDEGFEHGDRRRTVCSSGLPHRSRATGGADSGPGHVARFSPILLR